MHMKTGAVGCFYVSAHAIGRYIERVRPNASRQVALAELILISSTAEKIRTFEDGTELWRGSNKCLVPRLLFLVGPTSEGTLPVIRTVPVRRKQGPSPNNHRTRRRAERRLAFQARFLADSPTEVT
jgi:hypothetical protein